MTNPYDTLIDFYPGIDSMESNDEFTSYLDDGIPSVDIPPLVHQEDILQMIFTLQEKTDRLERSVRQLELMLGLVPSIDLPKSRTEGKEL